MVLCSFLKVPCKVLLVKPQNDQINPEKVMKIHALKLLFLTITLSLTACQNRPPVPEPRYIPDVVLSHSEILEVLPYRSACHSATPMQCLLVKRAAVGNDEVFGIGYNDIIGFAPSVGTYYKIKVRQEIDQNTGNPTGLWRLDEILSQHVERTRH